MSPITAHLGRDRHVQLAAMVLACAGLAFLIALIVDPASALAAASSRTGPTHATTAQDGVEQLAKNAGQSLQATAGYLALGIGSLGVVSSGLIKRNIGESFAILFVLLIVAGLALANGPIWGLLQSTWEGIAT